MVSKTEPELTLGVFVGIVSSVDGHSFCVVTLKELEKLNEIMNLLNLDKLENMFWIPGHNELFMVNFYDEGGILRAKRIADCDDDQNGMMSFLLIDTGEEFQRPINEMLNGNLYLMPQFLHEIPPIAYRCVSNMENCDQDFLLDSLYQKMTIEVLKANGDGSYLVNMWKIEEPEDDLSDSTNTLSKLSDMTVYSGSESTQTEEFIPIEGEMDIDQMRKILSMDEPVNFDAQTAVFGFRTRDDEHRCKFYNHRTGGCWKRGRCTERHIPEPDEGAFRDTVNIHYYDVSAPPQPKLNTYYRIKIISFTNLNCFTCYYLNAKGVFYQGKTLDQLREKLNSRSYNRMKLLPAIGELVTAKIKGKFYRARVLEEMDDFMTFPVFLVDEGTYDERVLYENIYEYCVNLKDFPFFAIEMKIGNIKSLAENPRDKEAQNWILATQQNAGPLEALIVENLMEIRCLLFDSNIDNIGEMLVKKGLVQSKRVELPTPLKPDYYIPG